MTISMIAAATENNVIGKDGDMPWHIPKDLKYFMRTTLGHSIIMGRKTFESFDVIKPLANRTNIVISRQANLQYPGAFVVASLAAALDIARANQELEAFIIGGQQIYQMGMNIADKIYLTRIHTELVGDTFFPNIDPTIWQLTSANPITNDPRSKYDYTFNVWERKGKD